MDLIKVVNLNAECAELGRRLGAISARRRRSRSIFRRKRG